MQRKLKGLGINELAPIAVVFIVAIFAASIGSVILVDLGQTQCENNAYTWDNDQCWSTYNATDGCPTGSNCAEAGYTSYNATSSGLGSLETFAEWMPTLALVVIAAIIIGVLMFYLGGAAKAR